MTSHSLVDTLHIDHGCFNQCVVDLTISHILDFMPCFSLLYLINCFQKETSFMIDYHDKFE